MEILWQMWRFLKWPLFILLLLIIALLVYRYPTWKQNQSTADAVAAIHAQRLVMSDVDGSNLPPSPDPKLVNATIEGIDANENGIRDDVELAIFEKYPNDKKVRAAELQYAKALQMELTRVFNPETLAAV